MVLAPFWQHLTFQLDVISTLAKSFLSLTECSQMPSCPPFKYLDTPNCQINVPTYFKNLQKSQIIQSFCLLFQLAVLFFQVLMKVWVQDVYLHFELQATGNSPKLQFCCHGVKKHSRGYGWRTSKPIHQSLLSITPKIRIYSSQVFIKRVCLLNYF